MKGQVNEKTLELKAKKKILERFILLLIFFGIIVAIFSPPKRQRVIPSTMVYSVLFILQRAIPYRYLYVIDVLLFLLATIVIPIINYTSKEIAFIFSGHSVLIPSIVLILTQNHRMFIGTMITYAVLPIFFVDIIDEKLHTIKTQEGISQLIIFNLISGLCTCALILHFYNRVKKSEKSAWDAQQQSENAKNALQQFLQSFSHELRNPLNSLRGNIALAQQEKNLTPQISGYLQTANTCTEILLQLINNILDSGKSEQGTLEIALAPSNICSIVNSAWQVFRTTLQSKSLNGVVKISKQIPPSLMLDSTRITQVIMNLMSNAIKFTKRGKIQLTIDWILGKQQVDESCFGQTYFKENDNTEIDSIALEGKIEEDNLRCLANPKQSDINYQFYNTNDQNILTKQFYHFENELQYTQSGILKITVQDSGVGMSRSAVQKLFQKFSQVSDDVSSRNMGTGLGLFITKEIINLSGGDIRVFSEKGQGTAFIAAIPTIYSDNNECLNDKLIQQIKQWEIKSVIVDDSTFNCQLISEFVKKVQGQVQNIFYDGEAACNYFKQLEYNKSQEIPDVLITDIDMPGKNGIKLCQQIRAIEERNKVKNKCSIIIVSGNDIKGNELEILKKDIKVIDIMKKPILFDKLILNLSKAKVINR